MGAREFMRRYLYYALIFILSLVCLFFLPMVGFSAGLTWVLPNTTIGWIVWVVSNLCSAFLNVLLFHFFIKQGKLNIKDDPAYKNANELLYKNEIRKTERPLSPREWHSKQYRNKGITLFLFTVLGTISFGQAILVFDLVKFLSQLITLIIGLVFGFMEMKATEEYWTIEYPEYAELRVKELQALPKSNETEEIQNNVYSQ